MSFTPKTVLGATTALLMGLCGTASAVSITVDEILFQDDTDPAVLGGTVDMSLNGSVLTIVLTNTSTSSLGAGTQLVGLGFSLPNGVVIGADGTHSITSGSLFTKQGGSYVQSPLAGDEWAYKFGEPDQGHFDSPAGGHVGDGPATLEVNTVISSHDTNVGNNADGDFDSDTSSVGPSISGIKPGIAVSSPTTPAPYIIGPLTLNLSLDLGSYTGNLLADIEAGNVILAFGSPQHSNRSVPDGGTTAALFGVALLSLGAARRKLKA